MKNIKHLLMVLTIIIIASACGLNGPEKDLDPAQARGKSLFTQYCAACHDDTGDSIIVGPSLTHIATTGGTRTAGIDAATYIEQSLLDPDAYFVEGFDDLMPKTFNNMLAEEEIDSLISYLLSLK